MEPIHTSDENFDRDVISNQTPVLVDFWAEWCGPCKALGPKLDEIAKEFGDKLIVAKMDVDKNQKIPVDFGVRGIPTMILFKDGKNIEQIVGNASKESIAEMLGKHLA